MNDSHNPNNPTAPNAGIWDTAPSTEPANTLGISGVRVGNGHASSTDDVPSAPTSASGPVSFQTDTGIRITDPAAVKPSDVVVLANGMTTSVEVAMSMGLLARNAAGHVVQAGQAGTAPAPGTQGEQPKQAEEKAPQDTPNTRLDDDSEATITDAFTRAPGASIGVAVSVIENNGVVSDAALGQLAAELGMEPEQARAKLQSVQAAYGKEAATSAAKAAGTSEAMVWEAFQALQKSGSSGFRAAQQAHVNSGRPNYGNFVLDHIAGLDQTDPARILEAAPVQGRTVRWDAQSRQVLVKVEGRGEVPWSVAVRQRLITIR